MPDIPDHNLNFGAPLLDAAPSFAGAREMSRAASELGGSIARGAGMLGDAALEVRGFQDQGNISEARMRMLAAEEEHKTYRQTEPLQEKWAEDWSRRIAGVEQFVKGLNMLPQNQIRAQEIVSEWKTLSTLGVYDAMISHGLERAVTSWRTTEERLKQSRDYDGLRSHAQDMPGATPEEREAKAFEIDSIEHSELLKDRVAQMENFEPGGFEEAQKMLHIDPDLRETDVIRINERQIARRDAQVADELASLNGMIPLATTEQEFMGLVPAWFDEETRELVRKGYQQTAPLTAAEISAFEEKADALGDLWGLTPMPPAKYEEERLKLVREAMVLGRRPGTERIHRIVGQLTNEAQEARRANIHGEIERRQSEEVTTRMKFVEGIYKDLADSGMAEDVSHAFKEMVMEDMQFWLATDGREASYSEIRTELQDRMKDRETLELQRGVTPRLPAEGTAPPDTQGMLLPEKIRQ